MRNRKWVKEFLSTCEHRRLYPCHKAIKYLNTKTSLKQAWDHCVEPDWIDWLLHATKPANVKDHRLNTERYRVIDNTGKWQDIPAQKTRYGQVYYAWAYASQHNSVKLKRSVCNLMRALVAFPGSP